MDNEATGSSDLPVTGQPVSNQPVPPPHATTERSGVPARSAPQADREQAGIFANLVKDDGDITGLVAYSLYKQNKLDWLHAFESAKGHSPQEAELAAYLIGESTPRRIATYRHLAEATLAGRGPEIDGAGPSRPPHPRDRHLARPSLAAPGTVAAYAVIAFVAVVAFWFAAHYTLSGH